MSNRHRFDPEKHNQALARKEFEKIGKNTRTRILTNTDEVIRIVTEWKQEGKVPEGMTIPALQALSEVNYVRVNVAGILAVRNQRKTADVQLPKTTGTATNIPLLSDDQIREQSEAARKNRFFIETFVKSMASTSELETWASFFGQFVSPPTEGQKQKIAAMYVVASKIPGGPGMLQSLFSNVKWAQISHSAENVKTSDHFATAVATARICAQEAGIAPPFATPPVRAHESNGHGTNPLLGRFTQAVRDELERCGLAEDLIYYERKYTTGTFVRIPKNIAKTYAVFVDELRLRDPEGLAAFRRHFKSLPWDFVEDFTEVQMVETPAPKVPAAPRLSVTERFLQQGRTVQERAFEAGANGHAIQEQPNAPIENAEATVGQPMATQEEPETEAGVTFTDAEREKMLAVQRSEEAVLEPLLALEAILQEAGRPPETNARILSLVQRYSAELVGAVELHGRDAMKPYLNITEGADFATNIEVGTQETKGKIEHAIASPTKPLEGYTPVPGLTPFLDLLDATLRAECEALLAVPKRSDPNAKHGRLSVKYQQAAVRLLDVFSALPGGKEALCVALGIREGQEEVWRTAVGLGHTAPATAAPVRETEQEAKPMDIEVNETDIQLLGKLRGETRSRCRALLGIALREPEIKGRFRIFTDEQKKAIVELTHALGPVKGARAFLRRIKLMHRQVYRWDDTGPGGDALQNMEKIESLPTTERKKRDRSVKQEDRSNEAESNPSRDILTSEQLATYPYLAKITDPEVVRQCLELTKHISIPTKTEGKQRRLSNETRKAILELTDILSTWKATSSFLRHHELPNANLTNWRKENLDAPDEQAEEPAVTKKPRRESAATVSVAPEILAEHPYLAKVPDEATLARCLELRNAFVVPTKIKGGRREFTLEMKKTILAFTDELREFGAQHAFLMHEDMVGTNLGGWRQEVESAVSEEKNATGNNGKTGATAANPFFAPPLPTTKRMKKDADTGKPERTIAYRMPQEKPVNPPTVQQQPKEPKPRSAMQIFEDTANDGFSRGQRQEILQGARDRSGNPAERDAWYAKHGVTASQVIAWARVYKDLPPEKAVREPQGKKYVAPPTPSEVQTFVKHVFPIIQNPFESTDAWMGEDESQWGGQPSDEQRARRKMAKSMNPLNEHQIATLRAIVNTRPDGVEPELLQEWHRLIAMRFGLPNNRITQNFAQAMLEAQRDPSKNKRLREIAMVTFS